MFTWLNNLFPYSDLHSLNLDWILTKMKETAAQAAQAIADSANALAQVIEAKIAAQDAQTAAQNAQTAANNAQTAANNAATSAGNAVNVAQQAKSAAQTAQSAAQAAQSAAQTAQNTANTAQSAAQTAQNTANTAQSAAQTAQSAAETAQSTAETANTGIEALNAKFPIKAIDINSRAVTLNKMSVTQSALILNKTSVSHLRFPVGGSLTLSEITAGVVLNSAHFLSTLNTRFLQFEMSITEDGTDTPNTVFKCSTSPVTFINATATAGLLAVAPFIIVKNETNEIFRGFFKISRAPADGTYAITCKVIFETTPQFNNNTKFVIEVSPVSGQLRADD